VKEKRGKMEKKEMGEANKFKTSSRERGRV